MQIPILNGITSDASAELRTSYPWNCVPVPKENGIANGYIHTAEGLKQFSSGFNGFDRGAISWAGKCHRVIGSDLIYITEAGVAQKLGDISNDQKRVTFDYSFDRLAIASEKKLYYYDQETGLTQVMDEDLGDVVDVVWTAGYFVTTDGDSIVVTDLDDPYSVNPLKYGSSEASPDPINSLLVIRNQLVAVNRNTCEFFQNIGGSNFPFQRIDSAIIPKGSVGTHASCYFMDNFAFVGGGAREAISVYVATEGDAKKVATREIETLLMGYTSTQLASIVIESRSDRSHEFLYIHLPDRTAVFDFTSSQSTGQPVWYFLFSGSNFDQPYRARNYVNCYNKWIVGDLTTPVVGVFASDDARQYGATVPWQWDTSLLYNASLGAIIHELELVRLPGRSVGGLEAPSVPATVSFEFTLDGVSYGQKLFAPLSRPGETMHRTIWLQAAEMTNFLGLRFRGMNNPYPDAFIRLEARIEALNA